MINFATALTGIDSSSDYYSENHTVKKPIYCDPPVAAKGLRSAKIADNWLACRRNQVCWSACLRWISDPACQQDLSFTQPEIKSELWGRLKGFLYTDGSNIDLHGTMGIQE
jgi:hypothetical protein